MSIERDIPHQDPPPLSKDERLRRKLETIVFEVNLALPVEGEVTDEDIAKVMREKFPALKLPIINALVPDIKLWRLQAQLEHESGMTPEVEKMRAFIIEHGGRISFAEYMKESLYGKGGFYSERTKIHGDFTTYAMEPAFAQLLIEYLKDNNFQGTFVELAGGAGDFKKHFLAADGQRQMAQYMSFDISLNLARLQQRAGQKASSGKDGVINSDTAVAQSQNLPLTDNTIEGVIFSNELPDVLPCRVFKLKKDEKGVTISGELFMDAEANKNKISSFFQDTTPGGDDFIKLYESYLNTPEVLARAQDGQVVSVSLDQIELIEESLRVLKQGKIFIFDYGYQFSGNNNFRPPFFASIPYNIATIKFLPLASPDEAVSLEEKVPTDQYIFSQKGFLEGLELLSRIPYSQDITYEIDFGFLEWWLRTRHPELDTRCLRQGDFFRGIDNNHPGFISHNKQKQENMLLEGNSMLLLEITKK